MITTLANKIQEYLQQCKGKEVAVVGDVMLDRYFWGKVSRISPEAPVPVIDVTEERLHLGGAANVGNNLLTLGLTPLMCGVIGSDNSGKNIIKLFEQSGILQDGLIMDSDRPTTVKTRIIGNNQQIARLDRESRKEISRETADAIVDLLESREKLSAIIFEDYNKGVVTPYLIENIGTLAKNRNLPIFVDPKKENFFSYKNVFLFKPNRKEAQDALGYALESKEDIVRGAQSLRTMVQAKNILITLGEQGMALMEESGGISFVATKARHVSDVSGAGDTVVATLAAMICGGASINEASTIANFAAGVVCEEPGIMSIQPDTLISAVLHHGEDESL